MKFADLFNLSTRMFKARTSRTLLTVLGMSIGIGAILFLVSLGYGLQKTLLERITTADSLLTLDISEAKSGVAALNGDMIRKISEIPGVEEVDPAFQLKTQGHFADLSADLTTVGSKASFLRLGAVKPTMGNIISDNDEAGVVISSPVAQIFGKSSEEMLGKEMTFSFFVPQVSEADSSLQGLDNPNLIRVDSEKKFKIVGIVDGQDSIVYVNSAALASLDIDNYGQVKVKCKSSNELVAVRNKILELGLLVSSLSDTVDQANKIFGVVQMVLMLFGFVALVVSAIGMFNTMTITLLERTEEIGIMKSIGASDMIISLMFFMESAIMGFLGGVVGVFIGWFGGFVFNALINLVAVRFGGQKVNLFYSPLWFVLSIIIFSTVVGFLTGFVPARRASKIDPLDALRYK